MALYSYDPDQNSITFGTRITGWADGEYVTAESNTDVISSVSGTDGDVVISKSSDRRCIVTFKVHQASPVNAYLSDIMRSVEDSGSAAGVMPLSIKDNTTAQSASKELVQGDEAYLLGWPALSRDRTAKMNEWRVEIPNCKRFEPGA